MLALRLESFSGEPLLGAYVGYRYQGSRFNFVDSLSYWRRGEVIRTDAEARFEIPGFIELHPPLDSGFHPYIEWLYVPELHHVFGPITRRSDGVEDFMKIDHSWGVVQLADFTDDPLRWMQSMRRLESIAYRLEDPEGPRVYASKTIQNELEEHVRREFAAFMARHSETPRTFPETMYTRHLSPEERAERESAFAESIEHEPLWGQHMLRMWPQFAPR
jgi:hypothetical protein